MSDENLCKSCFRTSATEPVQVKRDGEWVDSPSVRRCVNPECHSVRTGTLADRLEWIERIYSYKYFGDYELSPEQLDAVWEANTIAWRVPALLEALREAERFLDYFANGRTSFVGEGTPRSAWEQVRAAIAKAEPATSETKGLEQQ